jgi:hypothetical protein
LPGSFVLRRVTSFALVCGIGLSAAGCSNSPLTNADSYREAFSRTPDIFTVPEWAKSNRADNVNLGPTGPVGPDDLVSADGACAAKPEAAQAAAPQPEAAAPQQAASAPMPDRLEPTTPGSFTPTVSGGVALAMTECEVVRRAGQPSNVAIGADPKGGRKVTLTYASGPWPGIYQFESGRLKVIEAAPQAAKPAAKKQPAKRPAKTSGSQRIYVQ